MFWKGRFSKKCLYGRRRISGCIGVILLLLLCTGAAGNPVGRAEAKEHVTAAAHKKYEEDDRLEYVTHEIYQYDEDPVGGYLYDEYMWIARSYDEEEIAEASHAVFDKKNRLVYALGYSSNILGNSSSYCEENVREWNDSKHTCRYIYYKSNSVPYDIGYYVAHRYMFSVYNYQFAEDGRLLSEITYSRNIGSDLYGYSEELFFDRGYQAEYDGKRLMAELKCYNLWGTNESGSWEYRVYQYNDKGDCVLRVVTTEDEIIVSCYEYYEAFNRIDEYKYIVRQDWELNCDDGSTFYFRPEWQKPAVRKTASDGTVEKELYYFKVSDIGQQSALMPQEVEATVKDHKYVVKQGDCLSDIAYRHYGNGAYYDLLYRVNRELIGNDENLILPGTQLFIPEAGNSQDTKISS